MYMLRRTENEINHIVDRGQTALQERKNSRMTSDPTARDASNRVITVGGGAISNPTYRQDSRVESSYRPETGY